MVINNLGTIKRVHFPLLVQQVLALLETIIGIISVMCSWHKLFLSLQTTYGSRGLNARRAVIRKQGF